MTGVRALALVPLLAALLGCAREDPRIALARLDVFASRVTAGGLDRAWREALGEAPPPAPRVGLVPLLQVRPGELAALESRLAGEEDRRLLRALDDRVVLIQLQADPGALPALERIAEIRRRHRIGDVATLLRTLMEEPDPARRRAAWLARSEAAGEMGPAARELARARAAWSRQRLGTDILRGIGNHRGYDPATAERLRREVERALTPREDDPLADPWDMEASDTALQARIARGLDAERCLPRARGFLALAGLPESPPGLRVAIPPEGSVFEYASYAVDPPRDFRVAVTPGAGLFAQWASLHEFGHAAQGLLAPATGPGLLRRPASDAVSESCGKIAERLAFAPEWLERAGIPEADRSALREWERRSETWRMRSILADTAFEERLYADPDGDLDAAYAGLFERLAGVRLPAGISAPWTLERTLLLEPRGRFDYLLARCAQAAVYRRLRALPGGLLGEEAGRVLRDDVLRPASGARFEEWFLRATGGLEPDCRAWLEDVARP